MRLLRYLWQTSTLIAILLLFSFAGTAKSQEISNELIKDINVAVRSLCQAPDREGDNWKLELTGDGAARIKFIGGVQGQVSFTKEEWSGIKDSIEDRSNLRACVRDLVPQFLSKFAPEQTGERPSLSDEVRFSDRDRGWGELYVAIKNNGKSIVRNIEIQLYASVSLQAYKLSTYGPDESFPPTPRNADWEFLDSNNCGEPSVEVILQAEGDQCALLRGKVACAMIGGSASEIRKYHLSCGFLNPGETWRVNLNIMADNKWRPGLKYQVLIETASFNLFIKTEGVTINKAFSLPCPKYKRCPWRKNDITLERN